jgi:hypothetical protein
MADDNMGNTLDYVYELEEDTLTIWGGERGLRRITEARSATTATPSPAPGITWGGGGYESTSTRVK